MRSRFLLVVLWLCACIGVSAQTITKAEYFVDTDPGFGSGVDVPVSAGVSFQNVSFTTSLSSLGVGMHSLYFRIRDSEGLWSTTQSALFYNLSATLPQPAVGITNAEYFIDTDPGIGNATAIAVTPGLAVTDLALPIDLTSIGQGSHKLFVRFKDANGFWGTTTSSSFYKLTPVTQQTIADISEGEYFIDVDPGFGNATALSITPGTSVNDFIVPLDVSQQAEGNHKLFVRFRDTNDLWSVSQVSTFSVCNQQAPVAISATNITATGFTANWEVVSSIANYKLDVSADNFATFVPGFNQKAVSGTSAVVTGLTSGTAYKYRVNAAGTCLSVGSNVIVTETMVLPPSVPSAVAGSDVSETSFTANWSSAAGATSYRLDVSSDNFANLLTDYSDKTVNGTSDAVTGLTGGLTCKYRVRAVNSAGTTSNSNTITVTTVVLAPAPPNATVATNVAGQSFTANWDAVYNAASYRLDVSADDFATLLSGFSDLSVAVNTVNVTGLERSTVYKYRVRAVNITAVSANSNVISLVTTAKDDQIITFDALANKTYGDNPFDMSASSDALLPVTYSSSVADVATISGSTVTIIGAGTTTITASQAGNPDFNAAVSVDQLLTVNRAEQTITFNGLPFKQVTDAAFDLQATSDSGLEVTFVSSDLGVATISGSTVTITGVGTTTITASQTGDSNYNEAPMVAQPLVIKKASQVISFAALPTKALGDAAFDLTATSDSQLAVSFASSNTNIATVTGNTVTIVGAGTTNITASQGGNATYLAAIDVTRLLTITKKIQTITFGALPSKIIGDASFDLTATSDAQLSISFASSDATVATISGSTVTIVSAGSTLITASSTGDGQYEPASAEQTLMVNKAGQSITFGALSDKTIGDPAFSLSATSSSDLVVSFSSASDKLTVAANQVTLVKPGRAIITANQAGDANYNAAIAVDQSLCIKPAKPTITANNSNPESPVLTSSSATGNQWFLNETAINGETNATLTVTSAGTFKVQVTVDDCVSAMSAGSELIVTGLLAEFGSAMTVYPNPASDRITITWGAALHGEKTIVIFDALGRKMDTKTFSDEQLVLDVSGWTSGHYMVTGTSGEKHQQQRFVKK